MNRSYQRKAFTLIELLTVMAIITLLIGILTPALGAARDRARATAVRAQLNAMEVGLEAFHGDESMYPPSNAKFYAKDPANPGTELTAGWEVADATGDLQGAHLLVDALVGRDLLGYDPKIGTASGADPNSRWDSRRDRRQPYMPVDGVDVTSLEKPPEDSSGKTPSTALGSPQPTVDGLLCRVFRDKFGWPILYYRASPTANQNTPIIQTGTNANATFYGDGVYDGFDNAVFTSYAGATNQHKIKDATTALPAQIPPATYVTPLPTKFAEFIRSVRASTYDASLPPAGPLIITPRPVKSDRFILLSAGKDGIFGNLDDVANFQVLSTER